MLALKHSLNAESKQIIYVDQNATGSGNGKSWANAFTTIQAGLNAASDGTGWIVKIAPGTYYIPATLEPYPNTTISGSGRNLTIIDGSNNKRGFNCYTHRASNCNFEHLTIQNCNAGTNKVISTEDYSRCGAAIFGWGGGYWRGSIIITKSNTSLARDRSGGYLYDCKFYNTNSPYSNNFSVAGCTMGFRWVVNCIFDNTRCFNCPNQNWRYFGCLFCNTSIGHNAGAEHLDCQNFGTYYIPMESIMCFMNCTFFNLNATSNQNIVGNGQHLYINNFFARMNNRYFDNASQTQQKIDTALPAPSHTATYRDSTMRLRNNTVVAPTLSQTINTISSSDPHLSSTSSMINAGTTQYLYLFDDCPVPIDKDLDGNTFVKNGQIDVGAYAYIG